jgi:hypothetical protein
MTEALYLGHVISAQGVQVHSGGDPGHVGLAHRDFS